MKIVSFLQILSKFLQIHEENSHNKREVTVHGRVEHDEATNEYVEVLNECVKGQLKLKNEYTLSKHRGAEHAEAPIECVKGKLKLKNEFTLRKHRGAKHDEALHECVKCQLKFKNESVLSKHIQYKHK